MSLSPTSSRGGGSQQTLAQVLQAGNDAGGAGIENLLDPNDPQDAATKNYVDTNGPTLSSVLNSGNDAAGNNIDNGGEFTMDGATIGGSLTHTGAAAGFYSASPVVQQTYDSGQTDTQRIASLEGILTALGLAVDSA